MKKKYLLSFFLICFLVFCLLGCGAGGQSDGERTAASVQSDGDKTEASGQSDGERAAASGFQWADLEETGKMDLLYAEQFSVTYYKRGYALIRIKDGRSYLLVPENGLVPSGLPEDIRVLQKPFASIYLAASSAMDLFRELDCLDRITMTSTSADNWSLPEIARAVSDEEIVYVGKYHAPDYEYIVSEGCSLAIESTMIYHKPDTLEQLEALGVPVLVERSSYEAHPLGRLEWIRLYGLLCDKEEEAEAFFQKKLSKLDQLKQEGAGQKTAVFFYLSSNGMVNVRKPGDYISKMISMAGGVYALKAEDLKIDENALSTMNLSMEAFYGLAKDADVLIYNSTIEGELDSLDQLLEKEPLFADFRAVKKGQVYCARANMFQQTGSMVEMVEDFYRLFSPEKGQKFHFIKKL